MVLTKMDSYCITQSIPYTCSTILAVDFFLSIHIAIHLHALRLFFSRLYICFNIMIIICISFTDAGNLDFTPITSSKLDVFETLYQNNRRACFIVSITLDQEIEISETFSLQLSLDEFVPDSVRSIVTIEPNVMYVTIEGM